MKNLITLAIIATVTLGLHAQDPTGVVLLNYNTLEKKVEKSNEDIQHEKKKLKDKTWFKRGELFQDVFRFGLEQVQEGIDPTTFKLFYNEPNEIKKETMENGAVREIYVYDHMKYHFVNGALQMWERIDPIHPSPLEEALKAYKKTLELDDGGGFLNKDYSEDVKENLEALKGQLKRQGVNKYYNEQYDQALESFEHVLEINNMEMFEGEMDTIMIQYSGIIAREIASKTENDELYKKAIQYYRQLADVNYGGPNTYLQLKMDYLALGDTLKALDVLKEAYDKWPDTVNVVANIADTYIQLKNFDEGIEFMEQVVDRNPNIPEAYYWLGRMLINKEDAEYIERAIEAYKKAAELDPDIYYVWYDLGYIYYLQGADFYERANAEEHEPTREKLLELGEEKYDAAIPVLEKAYALNEQNRTVKFETLDLLQRIYYKEQMMDEYERVKELKSNL